MSADNVLLRAIATLPAGSYVSADTTREALDAAQLTSAERSGAFKRACTEGYLRPVTVRVGERVCAVTVPTEHGPAKGRGVHLYRRTAKRLPERQVAA